MSFTIQHPVSGLSWATNDDGKIILSSTSASIYIIDDEAHIRNTITDLSVRNLGSEFFETEHYGAMPEFQWTMGDDGAIYGPLAYGSTWVGEDLTVSSAPFAWKKVLPTRASSLKAAASVPVPAPIDPETFSSAV
jgi:hypothetical protein